MTTILVTGDLFIPSRAASLSDTISSKLSKSNVQAAVCTGNFTSQESISILKDISDNLLYCQGPADDFSSLPYDSRAFQGLNITVTNGFSMVPQNDIKQLSYFAKQHRCHVLCTSGQLGVERFGDLVIVKSGSLTGVDQVPGFAVILFKNKSLTVYLYREINDKLEIEEIKIGYIKGIVEIQEEFEEDEDQLEQDQKDSQYAEQTQILQVDSQQISLTPMQQISGINELRQQTEQNIAESSSEEKFDD
ncbi:Vacuolar protein sorting 29 [Spironucleus salmonicida]|uniref:Vacuolar protein sorting 29 n=1 Tax=Spironucleus salmonicida TaxID=348837 RepID=V6LKU4_9EUKA|nr:Vacuolar protein sorting 29 [Spironucleus salmonicida]|eukprot:EST44988.1 Vacuolar protein sorting 29 [Spironucleus salmonicida]